MIRLLQGDCRAVMATLPGSSVDAVVTDPPYELGFMGKGWDRSGVAFDRETWLQALRVLKPGGHLLAFGGTRTCHRMVCAIEDAGFEIRDQIGWAFGSGFPKSHNGPWGGTALKPAWEPICMARKPLIGTVEANWGAHGTGALNIAACRVGVAEGDDYGGSTTKADGTLSLNRAGGCGLAAEPSKPCQLGRWPANVVHDGSDEVIAAFPQAAGQSGAVTGQEPSSKTNAVYGAFNGRPATTPRGDTGSAARFFYSAKASAHDRNDGLQGMPECKVHGPSADGRVWDIPGSKSRARANHHATVKPTNLMRWLCRLVTPPGGTVLDPFAGSGSTLKAAELEGFSAIGIEIDPAYIEIARRRVASDAPLFADIAP